MTDNDGLPKSKRQIGLKQSNKESIVANEEKKQQREEFEKQADVAFAQIEDYKKRAWDLSVKYKSFIQDKTLPENRGPLGESLEKEVLENLIQLASEMNEDETQEQAVGSTALCMLLLKCLLLQRDIVNQLSFKVDKLEKLLKSNDH